jgi:alkanesulfonate monooxygenase SsuD/methylene tetrahydromethanopterin reductase-like flavin-dependent oxidoreductase (luciferase family)
VRLARENAERGLQPFGALVVRDDRSTSSPKARMNPSRASTRGPGGEVRRHLIGSGPGTSADTLERWARTAEAPGYDLLMVSDHIAITPDVAERYPAPFFDTPATLGWLAANTTRIELGTTVMLLPLRHVLDTARIVGTVDQLAGGRLTAFGVGLGWAKGEFEALGVPFEQRAAITDDYLAALRSAGAGIWPAATVPTRGRRRQRGRLR